MTIIDKIKQVFGLYQPAHIKANREPLRCPYCGDLYNNGRCTTLDITHYTGAYSRSSCNGRNTVNNDDSY